MSEQSQTQEQIRGRPTKFNPERCASIIEMISKRVPYALAAEANGVCEDTFYEWLKIGKSHRDKGMVSDYTIFSEAIKNAEVSRIIDHSENISSRKKNWQADAWMLERRWNKYYGANAHLYELNERLARLERGESFEKQREEGDVKGPEEDKEDARENR